MNNGMKMTGASHGAGTDQIIYSTIAESASPGSGNSTNDLLTANFNFDNEGDFSDLGIDIDAGFSVSSSTSTWIYGDNTGRAGWSVVDASYEELDDFTISSEDLTNLFSNKAKTIEENELAIIKNENDTYSIL